MLLKYDWEGNVRELEHVIERLVLLSQQGGIDISFLPEHILEKKDAGLLFEWGKTSLPDYLNNIERQILIEGLQRSQNSKTQLAEMLGIPLPTLKSKLKKFEL